MDFLDKILNTGSGLFTAIKGTDAAQANQKAATAQSNSLVKVATIGGSALLVIVILVIVFRRR